MSAPLRIGLAGLGTVGGGVIQLLAANAALIARRAGRPIKVVAISARNRGRNRDFDLSPYQWVEDSHALATHPDVDVVVEVIGGADGVALNLAEQTIKSGKAFVTANKAMIAHHGLALAKAAEAAHVALKYEAAVAGGIPVIKALREGAAANQLTQVYGILNGTCNYILSTMEAERRDFAAVLADAQALGYAEADPSFDIDGIDAAHKLSILASLAFGTTINFGAVSTTGIRAVQAVDIAQAATLGYRVRLVGMAAADDAGLFQRVAPYLVPINHPLAHVTGAMNAVVAEGDFVGRLFFEGRGAGAGPTASAIVADLIDIARGETGPMFGMPVVELMSAMTAQTGARIGCAYLRFSVADRPGVLAEITAAMRDADVSIENVIQRGETPEGGVLLVMTTHHAPEHAVTRAMQLLAGSENLLASPMLMPILRA